MFIPEITTRVHVELDTSELDNALSVIQSDEILSEIGLAEELEETKETLTNLKEPLAEAVAEALQSNQEMIISSKHHVSGMMAESVDITEDGDDYLVGNTASSVDGFPYPLAIETGRREVYPVDAKVLRWFEGGDFSKPVFARRSSSVKADPFVEPSIEDTIYDIESIWESL
jgi:hypothetical protein